jgi:hypothetical protein
MNSMWITLRYLMDNVRCRGRAIRDGNPEAGALTLEWIVIASLLVGIATVASVALAGKISGYISSIP